MRILIIGAGNTGRHLAARLCEMAHEVVVVDRDPEPLAALDAQLDIMTIVGSGSSPDILEKAELAKASLLIAVTDSDEVNILACICAQAAGVPNKVARVTNRELMHSSLLDCKSLGVDCMVSQNEEAAEELFEILSNPGLLESIDLLDGRVIIARVKIRPECPLLGGALSDFGRTRTDPATKAATETDPSASPQPQPHPDSQEDGKEPEGLIERVRLVAAMRGEHVYLPRGDTRFEVDDDLYVAVQPEDLRRWPRSEGPRSRVRTLPPA